MSDMDPQHSDDEQTVETEVESQTAAANAEEQGESLEAAAANAEEELESQDDPLAALQEQVAELQARVLRERADFDNIRKRLRREAEEAGTRAVLRFVRPLLSELDNFQLALSAADPERFQDFVVGVSMIKNNLDNLLSQHCIEAIPCEGVFDPRWHEVMQEMEVPDRQRGEIIEVLRSGWKLGNQVVRAAQVIVARPPPERPLSHEMGEASE